MKKKSKILSIILLVLLAVIIYIPLSCNSSCHSKSVEAPVAPAEPVEPVEPVEPAKVEEPVVKQAEETVVPAPVIPEPVVPEPEPEPVVEQEPVEEPEPEPEPVEQEPVPEPEPVVEKKPEPKPEPEPVVEVDEAEYKRSTRNLSKNGETVSKNEFNEDKNTILTTIEELQEIMNKKDFDAWLNYIAPESKEFYSKPRKVRRGNSVEIINGLKDYFLEIFIPARKQSKVEEIRYISKTSIKAVDIPKPGKIFTYYNFVKVDGKWYVELPTDIVISSKR